MARVLIPFRDRETWRAYEAGEEWDGTPERLRELCEGGFLQSGLIAHDEGESAPRERTAPRGSALADMTVSQLREVAESRGMEVPRRISKSRLLEMVGG